jgi:hypothetical protein
MSQADSINTTSRRGFLARGAATVAGGAAMMAAPAIANPTLDSTKASPALREAVVSLREADENLKAAKARFIADDAKVWEWADNNPEPLKGRAHKRWVRKWNEYRDATTTESWDAQLEAENTYREAQMAVARVKPRDADELALKAAVAGVYDKVQTSSYGTVGIISYSLAWDLFRLRMPS